MSVKSKPYYWLECEKCGCTSATGDYTAWGSVTDALTEAIECGWHLAEETAATGNIGHYCADCTPPWCLECDRPITDDNPRVLDPEGDPDNWECKGCASS